MDMKEVVMHPETPRMVVDAMSRCGQTPMAVEVNDEWYTVKGMPPLMVVVEEVYDPV